MYVFFAFRGSLLFGTFTRPGAYWVSPVDFLSSFCISGVSIDRLGSFFGFPSLFWGGRGRGEERASLS